MGRRVGQKRGRIRAATLAVSIVATLVTMAGPAEAAVTFDVRPISWDVIGLDSNNVNVGPNTYEVGARACNTSTNPDNASPLSTVKATLVWDGNGINALNSSTTLPTAADEVQTLTITGGNAGDQLFLRYKGQFSVITMPAGGFTNVTAAQVKSAILFFPDFVGKSADIAVVKAGNVYTVTFSGTLGSQDIEPITAHAPANEVQTLVVTAGANGDQLTVGDSSGNGTVTIDTGNTSAAEVKNAIQSIPFYVGKTTITVVESPTDTFTITFTGPNLGTQDLNPISITGATGTAAGETATTTEGATFAPNTGTAAGTMVTTTQGNGTDNWVSIQTGTDRTEVMHGLAPNECFDFYFNLEVVRNTSSYFWTRPYHILVQNCPGDVCAPISDFYSGPGTVPPTLGTSTDAYAITPSNRQIYVEKILSQNRNYVASTGNGGACRDCGLYYTQGFSDPDGPGTGTPLSGTRVATNPTQNLLKVGQQYEFTLVAQTATGGYGSWSAQVNWPRGIFQILKVRTQLQQYPDPINPIACCYEDSAPYTYPNTNLVQPAPNPPSCASQAFPGTYGCNGVIAQTWADAGGFCEVVPTGGNIGCTSPANVSATSGNAVAYRGLDPAAGAEDTAGNLVYMTFTLRVVKIGSGNISAQVWDGSGSSYHYNGDYNNAANFYTFCASNSGTSTNCNADTDVSFRGARAVRTAAGTEVRWATASETDNLGFNVYAETGGRKVKLNEEPVAGSALSDGGTGLGAPGTYRFIDKGTSAKRYWVEALDLDGTSQWHGPVRVSGRSGVASRAPSPSLTQVAPVSSAPSSSDSVRVAATVEDPVIEGAPEAVAAGGAKISVDREGWYRVPLADLAALGVDVSSPNALRLYAEGEEQPLLLGDEAIEFYGLGLDTPQTDTRVYWLRPVGGRGAQRIGKAPTTEAPPGPDAFTATVERRDRSVYFPALVNGADTNFFGAPVGATEVQQTVRVDHLAGGGGGATLDVAVQGVTAGPHSVSVGLNGTSAGVMEFDGRGRGTLSVPAEGLVAGTNTVTLQSPAWTDVSLVESVRITYPRSYSSDGGDLRFTAPGGTAVSVGGFDSPAVRVADVTDPGAPVELPVATEAAGGGFTAAIPVPGSGTRELLAFVDEAQPADIAPTVPSRSLASSRKVDMVIVAGEELRGSMVPLATLHRSERLTTRIVPMDAIYDQFSYGEEDPAALKAFLAYVSSNWTKAPRYVLFGGDASLDPRGFLGPKGAAADVVPSRMVDTHAGEVSSDAWFSDLDGDLRPEFALGRLPVRSTSEADAMVDKIVSYSQGPKNSDSLIAAGAPHQDDTFDFSAAAQEAADMTSSGGKGTVVKSTDPNAKAALIAGMNEGPSIVGYFGHGNVDIWGGGFFGAGDVASLTNADHPFLFAPMTCYNAYFTDPGLDSLSETLLKADGGAVAAYASSGATPPIPQQALGRSFFGSLAEDGSPRIGDATVAAAGEASTATMEDREVLVTWTLLGDPAMRLR